MKDFVNIEGLYKIILIIYNNILIYAQIGVTTPKLRRTWLPQSIPKVKDLKGAKT